MGRLRGNADRMLMCDPYTDTNTLNMHKLAEWSDRNLQTNISHPNHKHLTQKHLIRLES